MSKQEQRIEIKSSDDGLIELRYFDKPRSNRYYSWEMPLNEASDLAKWWDNGGACLVSARKYATFGPFDSIPVFTYSNRPILYVTCQNISLLFRICRVSYQ